MKNLRAPFCLSLMLLLGSVVCFITTAEAQSSNCDSDLARASQLIDAVARRDNAGPIADTARLCTALRRSRLEITQAASIMNKCLSGHARGENVGHLLASAEDIGTVISRKCR